MSIILRQYQEKALSQLNLTGINVLSICPGGGKTFTAIEFSRRNFKNILIIAHGTTVLKNQWVDELTKLNHEFTIDLTKDVQFTIQLPQTLIKAKTLKQYDLVIIDEAHEFYLAKTVQDLITRINPTCQLLLTGTPSKLIDAGFKPVIIAGTEVYNEGFLSDIYMGMVKSHYSLKVEHFNEDGDVKREVELEDIKTSSSLEYLVDEMIARLAKNSVFKTNTALSNVFNNPILNPFQRVFGGLDKTLIACNSVAQANKIEAVLRSKDVNCVVSTNEDDLYSLNVKKFQDDKDIKVLIVVRRGILGFNMPELINIVDFTMRRNIDRIYQLQARGLRPFEGQQKYFFKLCNSMTPILDSIAVQAALALNNASFMQSYTGKNLKQLKIPVSKELKEVIEREESKASDKESKVAKLQVDEIYLDLIVSLKMMNEASNNDNMNYFSEFEWCSYGECISKLTGVLFNNSNNNKKQLLELAQDANQIRPTRRNSKLGEPLVRYTSKKSESYDKDFYLTIKKIRPDWFLESSTDCKLQLIELAKDSNETRPNSKTHKFGQRFNSYVSETSMVYDSTFTSVIKSIRPDWLRSQKDIAFEKSLNSIMRLKPNNVFLKENQEWTGVMHKYIWVCDEGEFTKTANSIIKSWKIGLSGHPNEGYRSRNLKHRSPVRCIQTNEVFNSVTLAAEKIGKDMSSLVRALKNKTKCGGFNWEYVD